MKFAEKIRNKVNKFLNDAAKENRKSFAGGQPDCCSLNNQTRKVKAPVRNNR